MEIEPVFRCAPATDNYDELMQWLLKETIDAPCGGLLIADHPRFRIDALARLLEEKANQRLKNSDPILVRLNTIPLIDVETSLPRELIVNLYQSIKSLTLKRRLPEELLLRLMFAYAMSVGKVDFEVPSPDKVKHQNGFEAGFEVSFGIWKAHMKSQYGKEWYTQEQILKDDLLPKAVTREPAGDSEILSYLSLLIQRFEQLHPLLYSASTEKHVQTGATVYHKSMDSLKYIENHLPGCLFWPIKLPLRFLFWVIDITVYFFQRVFPHLVPTDSTIKRDLRLMFVFKLNLAKNVDKRERTINQLLSLFQTTPGLFMVFADKHTYRDLMKLCNTGSTKK